MTTSIESTVDDMAFGGMTWGRRVTGGTVFTSREVDVLRLLADGHDTADIATTLAYSERTIKNVIHDMTSRLSLRNRAHVVAYAIRSGVI